MKKLLLSLLAAGGLAGHAAAQKCGTDDVRRQLLAEHPEMAAYEASVNAALKQSTTELIQQRLAAAITTNKTAKTTIDTTTIYDVPIVVHIVHDYAADYLSDDNIFDAVKVWTDTYLKQNADTADVIPTFKPYIGNARIHLHLATIDPNGNPTKGIVRSHSYLSNNGGDPAKLDGWDPTKYINIWFVNNFSAAHNGAAAYAYYPSDAASFPWADGVICISSYYNEQKTVPHELGHVLNLEHTWGNTNNPEVACGDDDVDDTPPTKGHSGEGCVPAALYDGTCAAGYMKTYTVNGNTYTIDYPDTVNSQNIMDYTYCEKMFTIGQTDRMRTALTSSVAGRNNLITPANLTATGALQPMPDLLPIGDFSVERAQSTGGLIPNEHSYFLATNAKANFIFTNRSWNDTVTNVDWSFTNLPTFPTLNSTGSVVNHFMQPGWVSITMAVTGNNTGTTTYTNPQAVYSADSNMLSPGYSQNFNDVASSSNWPYFNYYGNTFKWNFYTGTGYNDNSCMQYTAFDSRTSPANKVGTPNGDYDDLYTPGFNLQGSSSMNLNFYTAGASRSGQHSQYDSLVMYSSVDGGKRWNQFSVLTGTALDNNGSMAAAFTPTSSSQWKAQTIAIPAALMVQSVFFRFRFKPADGGNNVYFDNFSLTPYATDVAEVAKTPTSVRVYPNPSNGNATIAFTPGADGKVSYEVRDIAGRTITRQQLTVTPSVVTTEALSDSLFPTSGIYLISVTIEHNTTTQKLVIQK